MHPNGETAVLWGGSHAAASICVQSHLGSTQRVVLLAVTPAYPTACCRWVGLALLAQYIVTVLAIISLHVIGLRLTHEHR